MTSHTRVTLRWTWLVANAIARGLGGGVGGAIAFKSPCSAHSNDAMLGLSYDILRLRHGLGFGYGRW